MPCDRLFQQPLVSCSAFIIRWCYRNKLHAPVANRPQDAILHHRWHSCVAARDNYFTVALSAVHFAINAVYAASSFTQACTSAAVGGISAACIPCTAPTI